LIYIIAGVSGVGKTTIAIDLAKHLGIPFLDADDFHPEANRNKMVCGIPLDDDDREPWLRTIHAKLKEAEKATGAVLACSALKEKYRSTLQTGLNHMPQWIFLEGTFDLIYERMQERKHFMPASLLKSQFDTYEKSSKGLHLDVSLSPEEILENILEKTEMTQKAEIGLIGLGVMGKSLSRNIARNGVSIHVFNRHVDGKEENVAKDFVNIYPEMKESLGFDKLNEFVASLSLPRKVFLMVNAGSAVDNVIQTLLPLLDRGDLIIDGGNSHYKETQKRFQELRQQGIDYIGTGVSGGELGALNGPSIMPGGSLKGYKTVEPILTKIAAADRTNMTCCAFIGNGGAGHFVKMVHNGIEYAEMQLIAEAYGILRYCNKKSPEDIAEIFADWNTTECASYLLEITSEILRKKENEDYLIDLILDRAGNKGTGSWTTIAACELGVPIPTITAALFARYQSSFYDRRQEAATHIESKINQQDIDLNTLRIAYQQARIINHNQGFELIQAASENHEWNVDSKELARIWTNGCIIRSKLMEDIYNTHASDSSLLLNPKINAIIIEQRNQLQDLVASISTTHVSIPCLSSSLAYLNGYVEKKSLANIIQAQRDYFGAHTYERTDAPRGKKFHTIWE